jgi:hypothetical protein
MHIQLVKPSHRQQPAKRTALSHLLVWIACRKSTTRAAFAVQGPASNSVMAYQRQNNTPGNRSSQRPCSEVQGTEHGVRTLQQLLYTCCSYRPVAS